ncbi:formylglycine-generating enzyme family protein [Longibacter salinarum]|nr:SUMF1/EgtB/PvdO family nonheme iron enzyme [Longibacter salinarum]
MRHLVLSLLLFAFVATVSASPAAATDGSAATDGNEDAPVAMMTVPGLPMPVPVAPQFGDMVRLPDGTFIMGLTDEDPFEMQSAGRRRVTVSAFYIDRFEVTNAEYREYLQSLSPGVRDDALPDSTAWTSSASRADFSTYFYGSNYDEYPVVSVTWQDAKDYCKAEDKRLPTEAEWEYAARAGRVGGVYPWSGFSPRDAFGRYLANFNPGRQGQAADGYAFTAPVGSFPPSRWGLHDVAGNAAEWVEDTYSPTYANLSDLDPVYRGEDSEETRKVVRGGAWDSNAFRIGVGFRDMHEADQASPRIGFRCAADISQVEGTQRRFKDPEPPQPDPSNEGGDANSESGDDAAGDTTEEEDGTAPPESGTTPPGGGQ